MVNTREIAEEYRIGHWAQIMRDRSASGMSIKAYCDSIGIHPNRYFYWQRKLREAAIKPSTQNELGAVIVSSSPAESESAIAQKIAVGHSHNSAPMPPGWSICETSAPAQSVVHVEIGKSRITVQEDTSPELFAKVCRMLVSIC